MKIKFMFFLIAIFVVLSTFCLAEGEDLLVEGIEGGDADDANLFGEGIEGGEETTTVDSLEEATTQPGIETTEDGTDFTNYEGELQINEVTPDDNIITQHGSFTNYQMNNALFMFGALAQASLFSFENNNYLFFGSIFDESQFQLILDEGGEGQITQRNSMGDMGRVYVSMDNGNLTQDDTMVFIPDGDNPTYIYYNTTDVEFEDGTIYYSDEAVTNLDNTDESSTVTFDEFGFTSVEIYEENNYTYNEYKFMNNEREMIKACKDDDSCEINIKEDYLKIEGKVDVYLNDELVINSLSSNNLFVLDDDELTFENTRGNGEILAYVYNGNFVIREETEGSFSDYSEGNPEWFDSYNEVDFIDGVLIYLDVLMFSYGVNCDSFYCTSLDFVSSIITGNVVSGESVREMLGF